MSTAPGGDRAKRWAGPRRGDLLAGLGVGFVLIPQSLAYATLAGMPPERGLLVAVVATIAAAPFASSPYLQTGPVAVTALLTFGALEGLARPASSEWVALGVLLALLVGGIRLLVGLVREGDVAYLLSRTVLAGFTPAAAIVIVSSQVPLALDHPAEGQVVVRAVHALLDVGEWNLAALGLAVASTVILLVTNRLWPLFPAVVVVVSAGVAFGHFGGDTGALVGEVPPLRFAFAGDIPWGQTGALFVPALIIAIVGFGDAAAVARNYAAETRTRWDADREFTSQGVANLASGLVGGFPVGGSFSRSAIGRMAGARTTWAGAVTGVVVLLFLPFTNVLSDLPIAVLAGIIIASVTRLLMATELRELRRLSQPQFIIALTTAILTVVMAPRIQWALVIGVVLAVGWHLRRETLVSVDDWVDGDTLHLRPNGVLYFGSAHIVEQRFRDLLSSHDGINALVIHGERLGRVDVAGALELRELAKEAEHIGVRTTFVDVGPAGRKILTRTLRDRMTQNDNRT